MKNEGDNVNRKNPNFHVEAKIHTCYHCLETNLLE